MIKIAPPFSWAYSYFLLLLLYSAFTAAEGYGSNRQPIESNQGSIILGLSLNSAQNFRTRIEISKLKLDQA